MKRNEKTAEGTKKPLFGLVLVGGQSSRMKKDKSLLNYYGKSQTLHCYDLLSYFCSNVYISKRDDQHLPNNHKNLPQIHDTFLNIGPLGGILSAMILYPNAAWFVLACDLPFVNLKTIEKVITFRDHSKMATAYKSAKEPYLPEPLCAIYESKACPQLLNFYKRGVKCPRNILINSDVRLIELDDKNSLNNINDEKEYLDAINTIYANKNESIQK
jgi:molybdopterin-guanine dinucleotide biosynthesis protein A